MLVPVPLTLGLANPPSVEALIYTTMACRRDHRPEYAMDGDPTTSYKSVGDMGPGDDFWVILSGAIPIRSIHVATGSGAENLLTDAVLETSADGDKYTVAGKFGADGTVTADHIRGDVKSIRIRVNRRASAPHLEISEIAIDSSVAITHVQEGPPRGFVDTSQAPDLADWAARAEKQMESFWPDTDALLYTDGFIPPNAVNVIYRTGPRVTGVAATGGGVMEVNSAYARKFPKDTGLTVHETAHVVQSGGSPGWLIEAVADYIRWIKFEPQNFTFKIDPKTATPHDPYRTGAAFLGWCELHYDSRLVTKLNEATRFGNYSDRLFEKYCGKPIGELWKEFLNAYENDREHLFDKPMPLSMKPRTLPTVAGAGVDVDLPFKGIGIVADGAKFGDGFDGGGAAYSANLLTDKVTTNGVTFTLKPAGTDNIVVSNSQTVALSGQHHSLWILAGSEDGPYRDQEITVTYSDGSTAQFFQNFSDWYQSEGFPGEVVAAKMTYRDMSDGSKDGRTFNAYAYGYSLDPTKTLKSVTLPAESGIRVMAMELAD